MSWRGIYLVMGWRGTRFSPGHCGITLTLILEGPLMPRSQPLDRWTDQVRTAFPDLSRPQATVLALYSFGMILAQRCGLSGVVTALVPVLGAGFHTLRSRLQEFYQPAA